MKFKLEGKEQSELFSGANNKTYHKGAEDLIMLAGESAHMIP